MAPLDIAAPRIDVKATGDALTLEAVLALGSVNELDARAWRLGLAAVIEEKGGRISYWALAHAPGKPDFHHRDCFQLRLPAASAS
jgi:hypothetical protein